jgi:hypothetical protein
MVSIEYSLKVTLFVSHVITADKRRDTPFINGAKKMVVIVGFWKDLGLPSG